MSYNWEADWNLSIDNRNGQRILDIEIKTQLNASAELTIQLVGWVDVRKPNIISNLIPFDSSR